MKSTLCITCWTKDVHLVDRCIKSFDTQTRKPDEIIVIGNGLKEIPTNYDVKTFCCEEPQSVSWSRNKAAEIASGDIIIYFDVDDLPHDQKIELIMQAFESDQEVDAVVHAFTYNKPYMFSYPNLKMSKVTKFIKDHVTDERDKFSVSHGHISLKKEILQEVKYDESKRWGEDADFCRRLFEKYSLYRLKHKLLAYKPSYRDSNRSWYYVPEGS